MYIYNGHSVNTKTSLAVSVKAAIALFSLGQYHKYPLLRLPVLIDTRYSRDQRVEGNIHLAMIGLLSVGIEDQQLKFWN